MTIRVACTFDETGLAAFQTECAPDSIDILILPELFDGGYKRLHLDKGASPQAAEFAKHFASVSEKQKLHLIAGTVAWPSADGKTRNASLIYSHGRRIAEAAKVHLFRPLGDDQFFEHGVPMTPVALLCGGQAVRTAVIVCYDLRFPELVRPWFMQGLDLLVVPARWPSVRDEIWKLLLRARAVENQCFVVGVNARDSEGGGSYAFAPDGRILFELPPERSANEAAWFSFEVDLSDIAAVKERLDTRPDARLI